MQQFANRTINVSLDELLGHLRTNREKHIEDHTEAFQSFLKKYLNEVKMMHDRALSGSSPEMRVDLQVPKSYEKDYDLIIEMLEMSTDTTIQVTTTEFQAYVKDQWHWKNDWANVTTSYTGKSY